MTRHRWSSNTPCLHITDTSRHNIAMKRFLEKVFRPKLTTASVGIRAQVPYNKYGMLSMLLPYNDDLTQFCLESLKTDPKYANLHNATYPIQDDLLLS